MPEFEDRNSLDAWLEARPIEDSRAIAARAALRVLPILVLTLDDDARSARKHILLPTLRASLFTTIHGIWQDHREVVKNHSTTSIAAVGPVTHAAALISGLAANASHAIFALLLYRDHQLTESVGDVIVHALGTTKMQAYENILAWKAISADATALEQGMDHTALGRTPLWPGRAMPEQVQARWSQLKLHLKTDAKDEGWEPWVNWYDGILVGDPGFEKLEVQKAQIPNEIWEAGPKAVNAEIARLTREFHDEPNVTGTKQPPSLDSLLAAKDLRAALSDFELDDLAHLMRMVRFVEDLRTLDDPALTKDRASRLSELADLMGDLSRDIKKFVSENAPGGYVSLAAGRYNREAKRPLDDVRPGRLWDLGLELAGSLKDVEVEGAFPDHLFQKLDHAVEKHREMMRDYFASVLTRMRPLDKIETADDAKPEDVVEALELAVDGLDEQDWGDTPAPDPEIPADMADRVDELKDILQRINQTTDETKRTGLLQTFWRKAKAASVTVLRYSAKVGRAVGWTASVGGGLATLFPSHFWKAVEMISKIFTSVPWPF